MHVTASTPPAMAGKCIRIRQTGKGQGPHPGDPAAPPCVGGIPISLSRVSHPLAPPAPPSIYSQPHHYSVLRGYAEGARIVLGVSVRIVLGGTTVRIVLGGTTVRIVLGRVSVRFVLWRPCVLFWKDSAATHALLPQHGAPRQPRRARGPLPKQAGLLASCYWIGRACAPV